MSFRPFASSLALLLTLVLHPGRLPAQEEPAPPPFEPRASSSEVVPQAQRPPEMDAFMEELLRSVESQAPPAPLAAVPAPAAFEEVVSGAGTATTPDLGAPSASPAGPEARALARLEETGQAPVLALPTGRSYPFGLSKPPTLRAVPYRASDIELEAGEEIDGLVVGDPDRWQTSYLFEGKGVLTPHVLVKPSTYDLATNLVIVTSRRTYHLELRSPSEKDVEKEAESARAGEGPSYDAHLSWWYPEEWTTRLRTKETRKAEAAAVPAASPVATPLDPGRLDFAYRLRRPHGTRHRLSWEPVTVFDDGTRTFLRLPHEVLAGPLPVLLGRLPSGDTYPLNAHLDGSWLIVPAVLDEAELVVGTGARRRSLRILHLGHRGGSGGEGR